MNSRLFFIPILLIAIVALSACIYRVDIQQGNRLDADDIAQVAIGMSTSQVEFLLGEPALIDLYHPDDWYYIYYFKTGKDQKIEKRVMILRFNNNLLASIDGNLAE